MTRYLVTCEDCDFQEVFDDEQPPEHVVDYWGSVESAQRNWSAKSAAQGAHDNHEMTPYEQEDGSLERHSVEIEATEP